MKLEVPTELGLRIKAAGAVGEQWFLSLEDRIEHLSKLWQVTPREVLSGGSESLVLRVEREDGSSAVIKLGMPPDCDCEREARVLRLAGGPPYVGLLANDEDTNALLLECLGIRLAESGLPVGDQLDVLCQTLAQGWIAIGPGAGLMTGAEKAAWLADFIDTMWKDLAPPFEVGVKEEALGYCETRALAHTDQGSVLVHGDGHAHNALYALAPREGLRLVDPDGLFAEPACDLAVPMRDWNGPLLGGDAWTVGQARLKRIVELTGVDAVSIWQWGFMERVSTGLMMLSIGMEKEGLETLMVAQSWHETERRTS